MESIYLLHNMIDPLVELCHSIIRQARQLKSHLVFTMRRCTKQQGFWIVWNVPASPTWAVRCMAQIEHHVTFSYSNI
jgi:hypothetical protein